MTEKIQKASLGRSPPRRTPKIAVVRGRSPRKTIEWAEVTCCNAIAVSNGKPITTPSDTMTSGMSCDVCGRFSRKPKINMTARMPAMDARRNVRKNGSISSTATRVAGNEPLKITTPNRPLIQPEAALGSVLCTTELTTLTSLSMFCPQA